MSTLNLEQSNIYLTSTWTATPKVGASVGTYAYSNVNADTYNFSFDISPIPSGAEITDVTFSYDKVTSMSGTFLMKLRDTDRPATNSSIKELLQNQNAYSELRLGAYYKASPGSSGPYAVSARCSLTAIRITITYIAGSVAVLSKASMQAGESITLTLTAPDNIKETDVLTHQVEWAFGSHHTTFDLAQGTMTRTYTIPVSWLDVIPDSSSGTAICSVTTYVTPEGGNQENRGVQNLSVMITVPESAAPTVGLTLTAVSDRISSSAYYQYLSKVKLTPSVTTVGGATIVSSFLIGTEDVKSTSSSGLVSEMTTDYFAASGSHTYTLQVVDSRGMTNTTTAACQVVAVAKPMITNFQVSRYSTINNEKTATTYGTNVWLNIAFSTDTVNNLNACTAYVLYGIAGTPDQNKTRVNLTTSSGCLNTAKNVSLITATISAESAWEFELFVQDKAHTVSFVSRISKGRCNLHLSGSDYGVAIGRFSDATEESPHFQVQYPSTFYNGIFDAEGNRIDGFSSVTISECDSKFSLFVPPVIRRYGHFITLTGALKTPTAISGSTTEYLMFTIPEGYRPHEEITCVCQGNAYYIWTLRIAPDGCVYFSKYRNSSTYTTTGNNTVLPFHQAWITV